MFDFSGSGYSEGNFITLGIKESDDVEKVVNYLKTNYKIGRIILWGRSMGAVTAILYSAKLTNQNLI